MDRNRREGSSGAENDWTSDVRPGREHDAAAAQTHPEILPAFQEISDDLWILGDLGYEGEAATITVAFKKPKNAELTATQPFYRAARSSPNAHRRPDLEPNRLPGFIPPPR